MSTPKPQAPEAADEQQRKTPPNGQERGSNAVEHEPDPGADPVPDGEHRYIKPSPYTSGNY